MFGIEFVLLCNIYIKHSSESSILINETLKTLTFFPSRTFQWNAYNNSVWRVFFISESIWFNHNLYSNSYKNHLYSNTVRIRSKVQGHYRPSTIHAMLDKID